MKAFLSILCAFNGMMWFIAGATENQPIYAVCGTLFVCTMAIILAMDSERKDGERA